MLISYKDISYRTYFVIRPFGLKDTSSNVVQCGSRSKKSRGKTVEHYVGMATASMVLIGTIIVGTISSFHNLAQIKVETLITSI